jgi:hypothetical protein
MITTERLIATLAADPKPVRRLRPPVERACYWLLLGAVVLALICIGHGLRPDFAIRVTELRFDIALVASLLTAVFSAISAFLLSLPDRSRLYALLPVPAAVVWVSTIGIGCLTDWVSIGPRGMQVGEAVSCFATVFLTSFPMSLALLLMLRYTARLRPIGVSWMGGLAIGAFTATAVSLLHSIDATVMILMWTLGITAMFAGLGRALGGRLLSWMASAPLQ